MSLLSLRTLTLVIPKFQGPNCEGRPSLVSDGYCWKTILWELFVCQAFLVSSLFSGTVLVMSWNGQMPKHVKGKTLACGGFVNLVWPRIFFFRQRFLFWGKVYWYWSRSRCIWHPGSLRLLEHAAIFECACRSTGNGILQMHWSLPQFGSKPCLNWMNDSPFLLWEGG